MSESKIGSRLPSTRLKLSPQRFANHFDVLAITKRIGKKKRSLELILATFVISLVAHSGHSSQLVFYANDRNAQFLPTVARSGLAEVTLTERYLLCAAMILTTQRNLTVELTGRGGYIQPSILLIKLRNTLSALRSNGLFVRRLQQVSAIRCRKPRKLASIEQRQTRL